MDSSLKIALGRSGNVGERWKEACTECKAGRVVLRWEGKLLSQIKRGITCRKRLLLILVAYHIRKAKIMEVKYLFPIIFHYFKEIIVSDNYSGSVPLSSGLKATFWCFAEGISLLDLVVFNLKGCSVVHSDLWSLRAPSGAEVAGPSRVGWCYSLPGRGGAHCSQSKGIGSVCVSWVLSDSGN